MKSLVIFYSLQGNTRLLANEISSITKADLLELVPENDISPKGFFKYLKGGKQAFMKSKPILKPYEINLSAYDTVFIGTPVWAFTFAPSFNTFFASHDIKNKKIAFFCCHGGGKGKVFKNLKQELSDKGNTFIGQFDYKEPLKKGKEDALEKVKTWVEEQIKEL